MSNKSWPEGQVAQDTLKSRSLASQLKETSQQPFIPDKNLTSALGTFQFWLTDMPQTFQELELAWPIVQTTELKIRVDLIVAIHNDLLTQ